MMQIEKLDTFVRGGPELPDEMIPGDEAGQFDSLLNALVVMPVGESVGNDVQVADESGWSGLYDKSVTDFDHPGKNPVDGILENPDGSGELSDPPAEPIDPGQFDTEPIDPGSSPNPAEQMMDDQGPNNPYRLYGSEKLNHMRGQRLRMPHQQRMDIHPPTGGEIKTPPVVNTPPIIVPPVETFPPLTVNPPWRIQGKSLGEIVTMQDPSLNGDRTASTRAPDVLDEPDMFLVGAETSTEEGKSDLGPGTHSASSIKDIRIENSKISDAIFERFAVDAESAIRESDLELPVEFESVIEQIEKPILEIAASDLEEGEPLLLKFRLKPAELGTVEIKLEKNFAGKLNIEIQAESEVAVKLLTESFEQLRESLKDSGWQIEELNIFTRQSADQDTNPRGESGDAKNTVEPGTEANEQEESDQTSENEDESADRLVSIRA